MSDVTDATFEVDVLERSTQVPVIVDLWAPWCGPCRTLGPMIESIVEATDGKVELAKVNVDENPRISASFQVQSIPAVFALKDKAIIDNFIGAIPRQAIEQWVDGLIPVPSEADGMAMMGDEEALRGALELEPGHVKAILKLSRILIDSERSNEAMALLQRIPETDAVRLLQAEIRTGTTVVADDYEDQLEALLTNVREDDNARQRYVDLLELMGEDDPRTISYRRKLAAALF